MRIRAFVVVAGLAGCVAADASAAPIGHWRMDEPGAAAGGTVGVVSNAANPGTIDGAGINGAKFSADVPGAYVFDPVSSTYTPNQYSLDASVANARVSIANDAALDIDVGGNKSFTVEFFLKLTGEPAAYENFVARMFDGPNADTQTGSSDRQGWQIDYDHGATSSYGNIRSRWDTPGTPPPDWNKVSSGGKVFVDTNDGSGNTGTYTGGDYFTNGDGLNDLPVWHHVALTYNDTNKQFRIFLNKTGGGTQTLTGTFDHGPTALQFGKFSGGAYGLLVDEVRYSSGVLSTSQFLTATNVPEPTAAVAVLGAAGLLTLRRRRRTQQGSSNL